MGAFFLSCGGDACTASLLRTSLQRAPAHDPSHRQGRARPYDRAPAANRADTQSSPTLSLIPHLLPNRRLRRRRFGRVQRVHVRQRVQQGLLLPHRVRGGVQGQDGRRGGGGGGGGGHGDGREGPPSSRMKKHESAPPRRRPALSLRLARPSHTLFIRNTHTPRGLLWPRPPRANGWGRPVRARPPSSLPHSLPPCAEGRVWRRRRDAGALFVLFPLVLLLFRVPPFACEGRRGPHPWLPTGGPSR